MRMVLSKEGWIFDGLSELEWLFLQRLPQVVEELGSDGEAQQRLYPDPMRGKESTNSDMTTLESSGEEGGLAGEWKEYVRPELRSLFEEARQVVALDLGKEQRFELESAGEEEGTSALQVYYSLEVAGGHVEQWNSTLNQARLLMNEVHDLAESEQQLAEGLMSLYDEQGEDNEESDRSRQAGAYPQWLLLAQYGFYGAVQSFLIEYLMEV